MRQEQDKDGDSGGSKMLTQLKDIDKVILYITLSEPSRELILSTIGRHTIIRDYYRISSKKTPTYNYLYARINRLIELGILKKKSQRPIRVGVHHDYYAILEPYIISWAKCLLSLEKLKNGKD
jgi:hypothetical protein